MPCRKCPHKANRLKFKLNETIRRAKEWAQAERLPEIIIYFSQDADGEDGSYGFGRTIPDSAAIVELLRVD
jgi:hypothetical protein